MEIREALEALYDIQGFLELFLEDDPDFLQRADSYNRAVLFFQSHYEQDAVPISADEDDELGR